MRAFGTQSSDRKAELTEHLGELRTRIVRSFAYILGGAIVMWALFTPIFAWISHPLIQALNEIAKHEKTPTPYPPGSIVFRHFMEPFLLRLQLSTIAGLVVAIPLITMEIWGFVAPALTPAEQKPFRLVAPCSVVLFLCGVALGFAVMPAAVRWCLSYLADFPGAILLQDPMDYIIFVSKVVLIFGLIFQLPIILVGLGKFGIIRSWMLIRYWRYIVVGITVLAMLVAPSADPMSLIMLSAPLVVLFGISILLVKMVEPKDA